MTEGGASKPTTVGSTLRIIVGWRTGGPYDLHARTLARHLGRYLPGNPEIIVENITGASGAIAVRQLATQVKADGLTIGLLSQIDPAEFIDSKALGSFEILGSPGPTPQVVLFSARSGITSVEAWRRAPRPPRFGSNATSTPPYVAPLVVAAALGLPIQMVSGYASFPDTRLAFDSGEIDAVGLSLDSYHTQFQTADTRAVLRISAAPIREFDAPDAMSIADERGRELLEAGLYLMAPLVRYYVAPPGTPADRVAVLREALAKTFADPQFLADARAAQLFIEPVSADALEKAVASLRARPATIRDLRAILQPH